MERRIVLLNIQPKLDFIYKRSELIIFVISVSFTILFKKSNRHVNVVFTCTVYVVSNYFIGRFVAFVRYSLRTQFDNFSIGGQDGI